MQHTRTFPRGVVASPHHLASGAGAAVLRAGGNAVDAAVAATAVLGVVAPYLCGPGGDVLALVAEPGGRIRAWESIGRTPAAMTLEAVAASLPPPHPDRVPDTGPWSVTVPGAVAGWARLLEEHGRLPLDRVLVDAIRVADDGVEISAHGGRAFARGRMRHAGSPSWRAAFGEVRAGSLLRQPAHAAFLRDLAENGPTALYEGHRGEELVAFLTSEGSPMAGEDLAAHRVVEVEPLTTVFGDLEVLELPPPTQGVTALQSLGVADRLRRSEANHDVDEAHRVHLQVEAVRGALVDRHRYVTDPDRMRVDPAALVAAERLDQLAAGVDRARAADRPVATPAPGGTASVCAADDEGRSISLICSNFSGFGSGLVAPSGVALHNRGSQLSLDPTHVNVVAPVTRTLHTLIPAMAVRDGAPVLTLGTMGGDGQPQTHLQLLDHIRRGARLQDAVAAWRWMVQPADGLVVLEGRAPRAVVDGLRDRGHEVHVIGDWDGLLGHAHVIERTGHGWRAATDPRSEGAAIGW